MSGMRYGISAGALVVRDRQILLVHHRQAGRFDFWVPPGGSLEGEESIFDCARRETREETGLEVDLDRIVYVQEFLEPGYHFCKFFITCKAFRGSLSLAGINPAESFLVDARFFRREDLQDLIVYPEILKTQFWDDLVTGFPGIRYLGLQMISD
jgi:ADP-ribose pyrophosphatase YjhB (NUDIX family)